MRYLRFMFFCTFLVAHAAPLAAQERKQRPMTVQDLLRIRNITEAVIAPDGQHVAYVISEPDLKKGKYDSDLWLVPVETSESAKKGGDRSRRLTNGPGRDDTPRWAPDSKSIAFLSDRGGKVQVWRIPIGGGEAVRLTDAAGPIKDFDFAPDGKSIAYLMTEPESALEKKNKKEKRDIIIADRDLKRTHLHVLDLATSKARQLTKSPEDVTHFSWSPDSSRIVFSARPTPAFQDYHRTDIHIIDATTGKGTPLVQRPGIDINPKWSPDGKHIAFITSDGQESWLAETGLAVVAANGKGKPRFLTRGSFEFAISYLASDGYCWSANSEGLIMVADLGVCRPLFYVPLESEKEDIHQISTREYLLSHVSISRDGRRTAFVAEGPEMPKEVYVSLPGVDDPRRLTRTNTQIDGLLISRPERIGWKSKDGLEIEGLLVFPIGYELGKRYPLLTYAHGGPASQFALGFSLYPFVHPQASRYPVQVFAGQGYAVFCPNPRGSAAYGEKFRRAAYKDWGGGPFEDIMTGIDKLIADGIADPDRLGMMGWSYGGYMTAWAISQTDRFKAASAGAGVTNLESMYGTTDIAPFLEQYFAGPPWKNREQYAKNSAMTFAGRIKTPTLIQHGEKDERVPVSQSQELYQALKRNGVPAELVIYPRQGHNPQELHMQADVLQRNVDWFKRWLK